ILTMRPVLALTVLAVTAGCGRSTADARCVPTPPTSGARVGIDPVSTVRIVESHSRVLAEWRRAGVQDRVLVHLDGHADLAWLPDVRTARLAAADSDELEGLEHRPYTLDRKVLGTFCSSNFIYPAARLGIVREFVWVVPDGTLRDRAAAEDLVRRTILDKL